MAAETSEFPPNVEIVRRAQKTVFGLLCGAGFMVILAVFRHLAEKRFGKTAETHPGYWMSFLAIDILLGSILYLARQALSDAGMAGVYPLVFFGKSLTIVAFLAFAAFRNPPPWRHYFALTAIPHLFVAVVVLLSLEHYLGHNWHLWTWYISSIPLVVILPILLLRDREYWPHRDWMHWAGAITFWLYAVTILAIAIIFERML